MQAGFRVAGHGAQPLIQHMPQVLDDGGDDAGAAGGAGDEVEGAGGQDGDDGGGDGGEGPFARADVVGGGGDVAEGVGLVGDGEVVHFVVHDDSGGGDDEVAAEEEVDGRCEGDGHARGVSGHDGGGSVSGLYKL